jgi:hypothetical protein
LFLVYICYPVLLLLLLESLLAALFPLFHTHTRILFLSPPPS